MGGQVDLGAMIHKLPLKAGAQFLDRGWNDDINTEEILDREDSHDDSLDFLCRRLGGIGSGMHQVSLFVQQQNAPNGSCWLALLVFDLT